MILLFKRGPDYSDPGFGDFFSDFRGANADFTMEKTRRRRENFCGFRSTNAGFTMEKRAAGAKILRFLGTKNLRFSGNPNPPPLVKSQIFDKGGGFRA